MNAFKSTLLLVFLLLSFIKVNGQSIGKVQGKAKFFKLQPNLQQPIKVDTLDSQYEALAKEARDLIAQMAKEGIKKNSLQYNMPIKKLTDFPVNMPLVIPDSTTIYHLRIKREH